MTMWMVRAGVNSNYVNTFIEKGIVAMGWGVIGSIEKMENRDQIIPLIREAFPKKKLHWVKLSSSQLFKFLRLMKVGDRIMTSDTPNRIYYVGTVTSEYEFNPKKLPEAPNQRQVKWEKVTVEKDRLTLVTRNKLGTMTTLFRVMDSAEEEIEEYLKNKKGK